jgi:hypothetical protein
MAAAENLRIKLKDILAEECSQIAENDIQVAVTPEIILCQLILE